MHAAPVRRVGLAAALAVLGGLAVVAAPGASPDPLAAAVECGLRPTGGTGLPCVHTDAGVLVGSGLPLPLLAGDPDQVDRDKAAVLAGRALLPDSADGKPTVTCFGTGTDGPRFQAVYVHWTDAPDRTATAVPVLRRFAAATSDVFWRAAQAQGGDRVPRWVTETNPDGTCTPTVLTVALPRGTLFPSAVLSQANRKYHSWFDASDQCGIAEMYLDERPGQDNANNTSPTHARTDRGCWGSADRNVEVHEMLHAIGGVQNNAPRSSRAGHCLEIGEVLCYADGSYASTRMEDLCPGTSPSAFDCNADDYWARTPAPGSWLAEHWNSWNSRFLGEPGDRAPDPSPVVRLQVGTASGTATPLTATVRVPRGTASSATAVWRSSRPGCSVQPASLVPAGDSFTQTATLTCTARDSGVVRVTMEARDGDLVGSAARALTLVRGAGELLVEPRVSVSVDTATVTRDQRVTATVRVVDPHDETGVPAVPVTLSQTLTVAGPRGPLTRILGVGRATTGPDGRATLSLVPAATAGLSARVTRARGRAAAVSPATGVTVSTATTSVSLTAKPGAPAVVTTPGSLPVVGRLTNTALGTGVERARVGLWTRVPGGTWTRASTVTTRPGGEYAGSVRVTRDAEVVARHEDGDNRAASTSAVLTATTAPRLTVRLVPGVRATATAAARDGVFSGALSWASSNGSAAGLTVVLERWDGSGWAPVVTATTDERARWSVPLTASDPARLALRVRVADGAPFFRSATSAALQGQLTR